jgi:hypothetical protein
MKLKFQHDTLDEIPEAARPLFSEQGGKYVLTGVEGIKSISEFERVNEALRKERGDHKATRDKVSVWGDLNADEVLAKLDRIKELETAAGGKLDEKALDALVEARIGSRLGPVERARIQAEKKAAELEAENIGLKGARRLGAIRDAIRSAASKDKVVDTAIDDVVLLAEREFEIDETTGKVVLKDKGLDPSDWLADMKSKRPHWWPRGQGGGASGSGSLETGANNPFSKEGWNLTKQGEVVKTKGEAYAQTLAQAAGTSLGKGKPK